MRTLPLLALSVVLASQAHAAEKTGWHLKVGLVCENPGRIGEAVRILREHRDGIRSTDIDRIHRLQCFVVGNDLPVIPMSTAWREARVMAHLSAGWSPVWTLPAFLAQDEQP